MSNVPQQLVTYKIQLASATKVQKKTTNVSSFGECLRPQVSANDTCFEQKSYPDPVEYCEYYPLMPYNLMERVSERYL